MIAASLQSGGRLIYLGCGTSGRLGVLDASECPVTFGVEPSRVLGLISGGRDAVFESKEGVEDCPEEAVKDLKRVELSILNQHVRPLPDTIFIELLLFCKDNQSFHPSGFEPVESLDTLVGLTASGRTPYVLGGLEHGNSVGAGTIGICCNDNSPLHQTSSITISPAVGPEVLTGSTRLKCGTAQKMVLNMLSTGAMIRLGKCYGNLMVDMNGSACEKLKNRTQRIILTATGSSPEEAQALAEATNYRAKPAILMCLAGVSLEKAEKLLLESDGSIKRAIELSRK